MRSNRWLRRGAWLNAGTHAVASAGMVLLLRRGLPSPGVQTPLEWASTHKLEWTLGWSLWTLAALAFVLLSIAAGLNGWRRDQVARRVAGWLAAVVVTAAAVADVFGQILMVNAAFQSTGLGRSLDHGIGMGLSAVVGNTLYSVGLLILTAVWHPVWSTRTRGLGYLAAILGLLLTPLVMFSLPGSWPVTIVTALLMSCVVAWSVSLALEPELDGSH